MSVQLYDGEVAQYLDMTCPSDQSGKIFYFFIVNYLHPDESIFDRLHDIAVDSLVSAGGVGLIKKIHILQHGRAERYILVFF